MIQYGHRCSARASGFTPFAAIVSFRRPTSMLYSMLSKAALAERRGIGINKTSNPPPPL